MKCENCGSLMSLKVAVKTACEKCEVLSEVVSIVTVRCSNCKKIFQIPVKSNKFAGIKEDH